MNLHEFFSRLTPRDILTGLFFRLAVAYEKGAELSATHDLGDGYQLTLTVHRVES